MGNASSDRKSAIPAELDGLLRLPPRDALRGLYAWSAGEDQSNLRSLSAAELECVRDRISDNKVALASMAEYLSSDSISEGDARLVILLFHNLASPRIQSPSSFRIAPSRTPQLKEMRLEGFLKKCLKHFNDGKVPATKHVIQHLVNVIRLVDGGPDRLKLRTAFEEAAAHNITIRAFYRSPLFDAELGGS
eukprot:g14604.t1